MAKKTLTVANGKIALDASIAAVLAPAPAVDANKVAESIGATVKPAHVPDPVLAAKALQHANISLATADTLAQIAAQAGKANNHALTQYRDIWFDAGKITGAVFDTDIKPTMVEAFRASGKYANPATIGNAVNNHKVAILGLCACMAPNAGETLQDYAKRVKPDLVSLGHYEPRGGGRPASKGEGDGKDAAAQADKGTKVIMTRELALNFLTGGNLADMQVLDVLTAKHMPQLRQVYALLVPAK